MTRKLGLMSAVALMVVLLLSGGARVARAEEICSGCFGKGRVGCGRCTTVGVGAFVGKCSTCTGFYATSPKPGERCASCRGTGLCVGCDGKGSQCIACKGSGRLPDGTAKALADREAKKQSAGLDKRLKEGLKALAGRWKGEGEDAEQGKYTSEMRWTTALDGAFLRHEERIKYESGAVQEYVSYMTWVEAEQQYLWIILFAPGRGLQIRGTPAEDGSINWQIILDTGSVMKMKWALRPADKQLDVTTSVWTGEEGRTIGTCAFKRTSDQAGSALVTGTTNKKEGDEATDAVLEGMKPLRPFVGKWTGTGKSERGESKSQARWSALLGGTVLETDSSTTNPDGSKSHTVAALTWDPAEKKLTLVVFSAGGRVNIYRGTVEAQDEGSKVTIDLNGANLVWSVAGSGDRIDWYVDVATESGERKVVEKGVDTKE